jgi:hypothetical protein
LKRREIVSCVVVLGLGGFVKGLLGSIGAAGICGWPEQKLFLSVKIRAVIGGKSRRVVCLGGVVTAIWWPIVVSLLRRY